MPRKVKESDLITVKEAATLKGVSDKRIYQWLDDGRLTRYERFGRTVIDKTELKSISNLRPGPKPRR